MTEYNLTLRQADQARAEFGMLLDELDFVKWRLAQLPTRAYFRRTLLLATASVWIILAAFALWLAR